MPSGQYKRTPISIEAPGSPASEARLLFKAAATLGGIDEVRKLISVPAKEYATLQKNVDRDQMDVPAVQRPLIFRIFVLKEFDRLVAQSRSAKR